MLVRQLRSYFIFVYIDDLKQFSYRPKQLQLHFELRKLSSDKTHWQWNARCMTELVRPKENMCFFWRL